MEERKKERSKWRQTRPTMDVTIPRKDTAIKMKEVLIVHLLNNFE
jgi:hypothetical protein